MSNQFYGTPRFLYFRDSLSLRRTFAPVEAFQDTAAGQPVEVGPLLVGCQGNGHGRTSGGLEVAPDPYLREQQAPRG